MEIQLKDLERPVEMMVYCLSFTFLTPTAMNMAWYAYISYFLERVKCNGEFILRSKDDIFILVTTNMEPGGAYAHMSKKQDLLYSSSVPLIGSFCLT